MRYCRGCQFHAWWKRRSLFTSVANMTKLWNISNIEMMLYAWKSTGSSKKTH